MSYILDALKRADAERQHGTVPSLHALQVTTPALQNTSGAQNRRWLTAGAMLILVAATAVGGWFWRAPSSGAPRQADTQIALTSPAPVASPVASPPPLPALAAPTLLPAPVPAPVTAAPVAPKPKPEPAPKPETPPRRIAAPKPTPPPPAAASADLPLLSELPDNIRRQIPAMAINGVVYSDNPGQRVLLVNQQVLTQGSQAVPDVKLEEIRPHSSVFSFQGTRFRLAH